MIFGLLHIHFTLKTKAHNCIISALQLSICDHRALVLKTLVALVAPVVRCETYPLV